MRNSSRLRFVGAGLGLTLLAACGGGGGGGGPTPAPVITSVRPSSGWTAGGALLTVSGQGLAAGVSRITLDGQEGSALVALDGRTCQCRTPSHFLPGPVDVTVTTPFGSGTRPSAFTYYGFPPAFPAAEMRLNPGPVPQSGAYTPDLCADDETVYVVWSDNRDGETDVYFRASGAGGTSWTSAERRLDTDGPGAAPSRVPRIACAGTNVYVVWEDARNGATDVYFNRSLDRGATWMAEDVRLDTDVPGAASSVAPRICCAGESVYVVWTDERDGLKDVYARRSLDAGTSWLSADVRLDTDASGAANSVEPDICCDGPRVYVVWQDYRDGANAAYANRSLDGGATWLTEDRRVDASPPGPGISQPRIACRGTDVYVVWSDHRTGWGDIRFRRSVDAGSTWPDDDVRLDRDAANHDARDPCVGVDGAAIYVAWTDARNGGLDATDIYFTRSLDAGATWLKVDQRLNRDLPGAAASTHPVICSHDTGACVAWLDLRRGTRDVFLNLSVDRGTSWLANDVRVNTDVGGTGDCVGLALRAAGARLYTVWQDYRHAGLTGNSAVYFSVNEP